MNTQLVHEQTFSNQPKQEVAVNATLINSPANLGSIFRIAEAFGVKEIFLLESQQPLLQSNRFKRVARSTNHLIKTSFFSSTQESISDSKKIHFTPVGIELSTSAQPIQTYSNQSPIQLLVGNERSGIPNHILQQLDFTYFIPMYGINSSLNVAQSLGISLYQIRSSEI